MHSVLGFRNISVNKIDEALALTEILFLSPVREKTMNI